MRKFRMLLGHGLLITAAAVLVGSAPVALAQTSAGETPDDPAPKVSAVVRKLDQSKKQQESHHFCDRSNNWLFAGVSASRTLDYFSTLNMRRRGRQEILLTNEAVDNHAGFAAIEAGATGVSIAGSYLFHRYGHHKLERWTSIMHIALASTGSVRNYCLQTAHRAKTGSAP